MSEHLFTYGPTDVRLPVSLLSILEAVAKKNGCSVVTYPGPGQPTWSFVGPGLGRPQADEVEQRVHAALDAVPDFRAWCKRHGYLRNDELRAEADKQWRARRR